MIKTKSIKTIHLFINGKVQGVSYRWWFKKEAEKNKLNGWVRNRTSNRVEAQIVGDEKNINIMVEKCRKGPPLADVEDVIVSDIKEISNIDNDLSGIKILETV